MSLTGWRFYKESQATLQTTSSSSSTLDQIHWNMGNWNSQHSSSLDDWSNFFSELGPVSVPWGKPPDNRRSVVNSTPTYTARTELHIMITFNTCGSRAAKLRIAHLCVRETIVIHVSCLVLCRTWHWPQVLSHPFHPRLLSFRRSHFCTQALWFSILIYPAMFHGGSTQIPCLTLLILKRRNVRKSWRLLVDSWKFRCQQQCFVKLRCAEVAGKPAAPLEDTRQNTLVLLKLTNLWECEWKQLLTDIMKITLQEKGMNSWSHYNLVHKFIPVPAVKNNEKNSRKSQHGSRRTSETKKEVIAEARNKGRKVHFASLMDLCHLKNSELEPQFHKYKGRVVLQGDIVNDDSGSCAVFTDKGSSASQMTAAKVMDLISRLPGCAGQAADAVSACTKVKMEDAPTFVNIPKSECPD